MYLRDAKILFNKPVSFELYHMGLVCPDIAAAIQHTSAMVPDDLDKSILALDVPRNTIPRRAVRTEQGGKPLVQGNVSRRVDGCQ